MNNDKEAIASYQSHVQRLKDEMYIALEPHKAELGHYLITQREAGRTVQNILQGMGISNRNLAYECMEIAASYTPNQTDFITLNDLVTITSSSFDDLPSVIITPKRSIKPHEWPNARHNEPYNETVELEAEPPYLPKNYDHVESPFRVELMDGGLTLNVN